MKCVSVLQDSSQELVSVNAAVPGAGQRELQHPLHGNLSPDICLGEGGTAGLVVHVQLAGIPDLHEGDGLAKREGVQIG